MQLVEINKEGKIAVAQEFTKAYAEFEKQKLEIELKSKEVKKALKEAMEKNGIQSYEDDFIKATYRSGSERITLDTKRIKEELPDVYEEYARKSDVASSVILEVKWCMRLNILTKNIFTCVTGK